MKTRITELFGIKYPILLSGMSWISVRKWWQPYPMQAVLGSWPQVPQRRGDKEGRP